MKKAVVIFIFLFLFVSTLVWKNCFKKSKLFVEAEIWDLDYFEYVKFDGDVHSFCFRSFSVSFVKKSPFGVLVLLD